MGTEEISDIQKTSKKLSGKLQNLSKVKDSQKECKKVIKDIIKIQKDMEKEYDKLKPYLEKHNIDKQAYNNAANDIKRATNQPTDANIQNATNKLNEFMNKLAA